MKIVVLAGGISPERDVSLKTGQMVYKALQKNGHDVILLDVFFGYEKDDIDHIFTNNVDWALNMNDIGEIDPDIEKVKAMRSGDNRGFFGKNVISICQSADIVFLGLHGESGENGKVQAAFDLFHIKYTGTDYISSALAMDKALAKELFLLHKIQTPQGLTVKKGESIQNTVPYPCVVKTCCGGSSIGVYIVKNEAEYKDALEQAFAYEETVIVEQYIKGREFSVCVIDEKALPIIEIAPLQGFYDYKNKYQAGSTIETCPADLDEETTLRMQREAEKVFQALRLQTYARMDFLLRDDDEIFCLEANTLPGMTPTSLIPQEAAAAGMGFEQLCEYLIEVSMKKYN